MKKHRKDLSRCFLEFGEYIMKREGISTLFIHGFPWALSYLLDHLVLFECACGVVFESDFEKGFLCNGSRFYKNAYKVLF